MKNYLLYDYLQVSGGAERFSLDLTEALPSYHLVVSRVFVQASTLLSPSSKAVQSLATSKTRFLGRVLEAIWVFKKKRNS